MVTLGHYYITGILVQYYITGILGYHITGILGYYYITGILGYYYITVYWVITATFVIPQGAKAWSRFSWD